MPELPEVQTVVTTLTPRVIGRRVRKVIHLRSDMVTPDGFDLAKAVTGRTIVRLERRGKRIVFEMDDANRFFIHLGMTGRLTVEAAKSEVQRHTHLIFDL